MPVTPAAPGPTRARKDAADMSARETADRREWRDENAAAADAAPTIEEHKAPPDPVHAAGPSGAVALSDDLDDDESDETAKPFLYDDDRRRRC